MFFFPKSNCDRKKIEMIGKQSPLYFMCAQSIQLLKPPVCLFVSFFVGAFSFRDIKHVFIYSQRFSTVFLCERLFYQCIQKCVCVRAFWSRLKQLCVCVSCQCRLQRVVVESVVRVTAGRLPGLLERLWRMTATRLAAESRWTNGVSCPHGGRMAHGKVTIAVDEYSSNPTQAFTHYNINQSRFQPPHVHM